MEKVVPIRDSIYLDFLSKFGVGGAHPGGFELTKEILQGERIHAGTRILDAGCGTGQTAAYLASTYEARVIGVDINPIMVEKAKQRMEKNNLPVKIIQGSIEKLPLKGGMFDLILSESVLSFVNKPRALQEIYRLLKPGGRFIANELTVNKKPEEWVENEIKTFYGFDSLPVERDWISLLERIGFKNIKIHSQTTPILQHQATPEFHYSAHIDPKLYAVMNQHFQMIAKYHEILDYRIFSCSK
ncbi:class I SAM-dependent methyltransferase [Neobacillus notoginsengisoli]|uniref:Class I SAM-dependent methyltransferase n=1 Tax=Neobacillus notoginsengisoli TaxID=1578198 RepID=A0A417YWJ1_9BACI|nr:class I SAM-dependent methyltransferase [Neobacillus notoginsengisoli]RHW41648.1 class I SAM-dependent methyltransferase [Neobacillus notoginsengisoli]